MLIIYVLANCFVSTEFQTAGSRFRHKTEEGKLLRKHSWSLRHVLELESEECFLKYIRRVFPQIADV